MRNIFLALLVSVVSYYAIDIYAVNHWNNTESLIVRVIEAGPESVIHDDSYDMLERDTVMQILSGNNADEVLTVRTVRLAGSGLEVIAGHRYLLVWDMFTDGTVQYSIADKFRVSSVAGVIIAACTVLIALTGKRGFLALLGLGGSVCILIFSMIPLMSMAWPPVMLALASTLIISTVTILCVVNPARYRLIALSGSMGGILCALALGSVMVYLWQLNGLAGESAPLLASTMPQLNMQGLLLAAILIGAVGAVLDVAVSITAAMTEILDVNPDIALDRLLKAGLNVGTQTLGSMINTLILAYMGSSLPMAILICSSGTEISGLMNDPCIAQETAQSLAGTIGLLAAIPITSICFTLQEYMRRKYA